MPPKKQHQAPKMRDGLEDASVAVAEASVQDSAATATKPNVKRLKPGNVETHRRAPLRVRMQTLADLAGYEDVPFPYNSKSIETGRFYQFFALANRILTTTLVEFDDLHGALNPTPGFRKRPLDVAVKLSEKQVMRLALMRRELMDHLIQFGVHLQDPPPESGGDSARWSVACGMWLLVCQMNCVLRRFGLGGDALEEYNPSAYAYIAAQKLVIELGPVMKYSVRALQMMMTNLMSRLDGITDYHPDLAKFLDAASHAFAEAICSSGRAKDRYNAPEFCIPVHMAHTGLTRDVVVKDSKTEKSSGFETCTTDFIVSSMWWFITAHLYIRRYLLIAPPPAGTPPPTSAKRKLTALPNGDPPRKSIEETRQLRWFPTKEMLFRANQFFCEYAVKGTDDIYQHGLNAFVTQFEPYPCDARIYCAMRNTHIAVPSDVLQFQFPNRSPVGVQYIISTKYDIPIVQWLHDSWNNRYGDTRVRTGNLRRLNYHIQLAVLYIIHSFVASKTSISFRHRFVIYQHDPSFEVAAERLKRNGVPFITQQLGYWALVFMHPCDPDTDVVPFEASMHSDHEHHGTQKFFDAEDEQRPKKRRASEDDDKEIDDGMAEDAQPNNDDDDGDAMGADADDEEDDDEEESDSVFGKAQPAAFIGPAPIDPIHQWKARMELEKHLDENGADINNDRIRNFGHRIPTHMPNPKFIRVYEFETMLEVFVAWCIAVLHVNKGVIDNVDLSRFIRGILGWPEHAHGETFAYADIF